MAVSPKPSRDERRAANDAEAQVRGEYQGTAQDAMDGDGAAQDRFAVALTGMTFGELKAQDPANAAAVMDFIGDIAAGRIRPDVALAGQSASSQGKMDGTWLPDGVSGAFAGGTDGTNGTILLARALDAPMQTTVMREEYGEAIGAAAEARGITLAPGDVGERMRRIVLPGGDDGQVSRDLFEAQPDDTVTVMLDGQSVEARAFSFGGFISGIVDAATDVFDGVVDTATDVVDGVVDVATDVVDGVVDVATDVVGGFFPGIPRMIPSAPPVEQPVVSEPAPAPAPPFLLVPEHTWLGPELVSASLAQDQSQVDTIKTHLFQADGVFAGYPANGVLSAYEIKAALGIGIGQTAETSLPLPVSDEVLGQLEVLVRNYGTKNPETGYFAVDDAQLTQMIMDGHLGLGVSAFAGSGSDVVAVTREPITDSPELGHWWNTAIEKIEDGGKSIAKAISGWTGHKVEDIEHFFSGSMTAAEAAAKGMLEMARGFGKAVIARDEAAVGAFDKIVGAITGIEGLKEEGKAWMSAARDEAVEGGNDMLVGLIMSLGSMDEAQAKDIIHKGSSAFEELTGLAQGRGSEIVENLIPDLENIINQGAASVAGVASADVMNGDDPLQKFLTKDLKSRFDYAVDIGQAVQDWQGFDVEQFRAFVTHPRRIENGKHMIQLRLRVLDVAGAAAGGLDAGVLGVHDIVIPIEYSGAFQNVSVGDVQFSATVGGMGEYAISENTIEEVKEGAAFIEEHGQQAWDKVKGLWNSLQGAAAPGAVAAGEPRLGAIPGFDGIENAVQMVERNVGQAVTTGTRVFGEQVQKRGTLEVGVGIGLNTAYNLTNLAKRSSASVVMPMISEAIGAVLGGGVAGSFAAAFSATAGQPNFKQVATAVHIGADLGSGFADFILDSFYNKKEIQHQLVGFSWGALRAQGRVDPETAASAIMRGRVQMNYDFLGKEITVNPEQDMVAILKNAAMQFDNMPQIRSFFPDIDAVQNAWVKPQGSPVPVIQVSTAP